VLLAFVPALPLVLPLLPPARLLAMLPLVSTDRLWQPSPGY
jgi:hypothetical protein